MDIYEIWKHAVKLATGLHFTIEEGSFADTPDDVVSDVVRPAEELAQTILDLQNRFTKKDEQCDTPLSSSTK